MVRDSKRKGGLAEMRVIHNGFCIRQSCQPKNKLCWFRHLNCRIYRYDDRMVGIEKLINEVQMWWKEVQPYKDPSIEGVPRSAGVYIIYDLSGPIYVGRSSWNIHGRLLAHLHRRGNRNIAMAVRVGASSSLSFKYYLTDETLQSKLEAILIQELGVDKFANLRRETLPEDWE